MEILLIDIGALAMFLGYIAIVYWHATTHEAHPDMLDDRTVPGSSGAMGANHLGRESATARSARSSVEIGQCSSQLLQYASIPAPDFSSSASSSGGYPVSTRSRPHLGHSDENGV